MRATAMPTAFAAHGEVSEMPDAPLAGGLLAAHGLEAGRVIDSGLYVLVRAVMLRITSTYAFKMAGVFMISLATISMRTRVMPRSLTLATYLLALVLLLSIGANPWMVWC